jgi:cation diffusion facilitator family transporter
VKEKIAKISILANAILAGGKIIVGIISNSAAVLAEGFHSLADVVSSLIGYLSIKRARKPADEKHPYGHFKFEVLGGIGIGIFLLAAGIEAIFEAYQNYLDPQKIKLSYLTFAVMIISMAMNFATSRLKTYYGKKENSLTLLADGAHDKADVLASSAVLLGLFLTHYWIYADSLLAFLIGLYIIKEAIPIGKEAIDSLLDVSAPREVEEKIKEIAKSQGIEIPDLKTQQKGSVFTANLEINLPKNLSVDQATKISESLRERLTKEIKNLVYVSIQIKSHEVETGFYKPAIGALGFGGGFGFGRGFSWQRKGRFRGEIEQARGEGPGGYCVCPKCGYKVPHERGVPCSTLQCPKCKINLVRK